MGFWKSARGICGDSWADKLDDCMDEIAKLRVENIDPLPGLLNVGIDSKNGEHEITMQELADLVEFCSRGHLVVEVRHPEADGERPLSQLRSNAVQTYENRGQIQ